MLSSQERPKKGGAMAVGVLGLQGDAAEHAKMLERLGKEARVVKGLRDLEDLEGLIIPGGESTTMGRLIRREGLDEAIKSASFPVFGTCAGAVLLARRIAGTEQYSLGLMGMEVERNAYGRQKESFEAEVEIPALGGSYRAVFIRAPVIKQVNEGEVLAKYRGSPILVREGRCLAATFHPELTLDLRVHQYFLEMVDG